MKNNYLPPICVSVEIVSAWRRKEIVLLLTGQSVVEYRLVQCCIILKKGYKIENKISPTPDLSNFLVEQFNLRNYAVSV